MIVSRDFGIMIADKIPWIRPLLRYIYRLLPNRAKDNPTSWLMKVFHHSNHVSFVQIGAFNGIADDPIHPLVLNSMKWNGVLVEPQSEAFKRLVRNYQNNRDRLIFVNCAVSSSSGQTKLYKVNEIEIKRLNLGDWARELASLNSSIITARLPDVAIDCEVVRSVTFDELILECGLNTVDLIVLDTEGHEFEILKYIDLDRYRVRALLYEYVHLSSIDEQQLRVRLMAAGYTIRKFGYDILAYRN